MSNKIQIDDLFRDNLSDGKEQLNLGAWANMERLLDGQNPYNNPNEQDDTKKKRRFLPLFAIFLLLTSALTATFLWKNHKDDSNKHAISKSQNNIIAPQNSFSPNENNDTANLQTAKQISYEKDEVAMNDDIDKNQNASTLKKSTSKKRTHNEKNEFQKNNLNIDNNESINKNNLAKNKKNNNIEKEKNNNAESKPTFSKNENKKSLEQENIENSNETFKKVNHTKTVHQIVKEASNIKNRDGSIKSVNFDTIAINKNEIENIVLEKTNNNEQNNMIERDENFKYHPRYIGDIFVDDKQIDLPLYQSNIQKINTPSLTKTTETKNKVKKQETSIDKLSNTASNTFEKISEASNNFFSMFKVLDLGMSVGINAALFNTKHNYGGFHAGITNRTAISDMFSIITELKVFLRNNSGFSINDVQTKILNKSIDTITYSQLNQTAYNYQLDSITKKYSFKSFLSIELPILLNARFNNISIFGGPNFVYNPKMKITEVDKKYDPSNKQQILQNGIDVEYPTEKTFQYTRQDFGSRFGIGYAIGVSYNFNPKIYIDLRMSKVIWDNTKYISQREISNGVTKVPFMQLSLGYKFSDK